ncbi:NADPH:quinone reductase-like Zn-dependent oxidoreductase [Bradyrhizobium sp. AZCC 2230]
MKAVGYKKSLPIEDQDALIDFETTKPEPKGRDIRVAVKAISANRGRLQGAQARRPARRRDQDFGL